MKAQYPQNIVHWLLIGSVTRDKLGRPSLCSFFVGGSNIRFRKGLGWYGNDNGECIPTQAIIRGEELAIHAYLYNASYLSHECIWTPE
jgi:hypothetical protein